MVNISFVTWEYYPLFPGYRWNPYLFPIWYFQKDLRARGINVYFEPLRPPRRPRPADVICLDSKSFTLKKGRITDEELGFLEVLRRRCDRLLWFDNDESTGTTQFEVLPYVDGYYRRQLLRDRHLYYQVFHGDRVYADYYHRKYGIDAHAPTRSPLLPREGDKLGLSWNWAFRDYRWTSKSERLLCGFSRAMNLEFCAPDSERPTLLSARFATSISYKAVVFQRECLQSFVKDRDLAKVGYISKRAYLKELRNCRAVLSPW